MFPVGNTEEVDHVRDQAPAVSVSSAMGEQ
jgi:hypothetical protein